MVAAWYPLLQPLPGATGNNLLSYGKQHMSKEFGEAWHIISSISFQLGLVSSCCKHRDTFSTATHDHNILFAQFYNSATASTEHLTPQIFTDKTARKKPGRHTVHRQKNKRLKDRKATSQHMNNFHELMHV